MGFSRTLALRRREMRLVRLFRRKDSLRVGIESHNFNLPYLGEHTLQHLFATLVVPSTGALLKNRHGRKAPLDSSALSSCENGG